MNFIEDALNMWKSWSAGRREEELRKQRRNWSVGEMLLSHPEKTREQAEALVDAAERVVQDENSRRLGGGYQPKPGLAPTPPSSSRFGTVKLAPPPTPQEILDHLIMLTGRMDNFEWQGALFAVREELLRLHRKVVALQKPSFTAIAHAKHVKRGGIYSVLSKEAHLQMSSRLWVSESDKVSFTIYTDGKVFYIRPTDEFFDGRFLVELVMRTNNPDLEDLLTSDHLSQSTFKGRSRTFTIVSICNQIYRGQFSVL